MAKKRKAAASKRASRRRPARRRRASADSTVNTLVILVVIVIVLGGLYLYAQNKKQALLESISPALAAIMTPAKPVLAPRTAAVAVQSLTVPVPEPAAGSDGRQPITVTEVK